jgi:hypothetical protein
MGTLHHNRNRLIGLDDFDRAIRHGRNIFDKDAKARKNKANDPQEENSSAIGISYDPKDTKDKDGNADNNQKG